MRGKAGRVPDRLQDIREAIGNARNDLGSLTKEQFLADGKTQRAVIESIIVIGEAANNVMRLAPHIEQQAPEVWQHFQGRVRHADHSDPRIFQGRCGRGLGYDKERFSRTGSTAR